MIKDGIDPNNMLMFTFTNKAAKEIKERVISKIGDDGKKITVGTYHSVCARLLRKYANLLGYQNNFSIYDSEDSSEVLKKICKSMKLDEYEVSAFISDCKNKMISPQKAFTDTTPGSISGQYASAYREYQAQLFAANSMDFDDLIRNMILVLESNYDVLQVINNKYKYIVLDEYHDSSSCDIRLTELLAGEEKNVCMILDDEQSIYSFRGADLEAVLGVRDIFDVKTFILKQNYRSTEYIVNASRSLIGKNTSQIDKEIFTENEEGTPIIHFEEGNSKDQANRIAKLIRLVTTQYGLEYKDVAILYRMSYISRDIEQSLLINNIPYTIVSGTPFYSRKEIKDVLSYCRLVYNPYDFEAFKRIATTPKRGIGEKSLENIKEYAENTYSQPIDYIQACREIELKGTAKKGIENLNAILEELVEYYEMDDANDFLKRVISITSYNQHLIDFDKATSEDRLANLIELLELSRTFDSIEELIQNTILDSQIDQDNIEDDNKVQLMTMHASKGLEYKCVILAHLIEGVCPHWKSKELHEVEEERRLCYVGMTRAEKFLFITSPKMIMKNGAYVKAKKSRFIKEINDKFIKKY